MAYGPHAAHPARTVWELPAGGCLEYLVWLRLVRIFHRSSQPDDPQQLYRRLGDFQSAEHHGLVPRPQMVVFKTKGNYLREWIRCVGVYSGGILFSVLTLPVSVVVIRRNTRFFAQAPYIAGALLTAFIVVYSFAGYKKFSFRTPA
jgi:hypothetical protein